MFMERRLEADIFPHIGTKPIADLTAPDLLRTLRTIEARGAHELAHRCKQTCGQNYTSHQVRLSSLLENFAPNLGIEIPKKGSPEEIRINGFQEAGNKLREITGRTDAMVSLAIGAINNIRDGQRKKPKNLGQNRRAADKLIPVRGQAYFINSLKHSSEAELLRQIYGDNFFLISVYSPHEHLFQRLCEQIRESHKASKVTKGFEEAAKDLIERDQKQENLKHGQGVRDVFHLADFFLNNSDSRMATGFY